MIVEPTKARKYCWDCRAGSPSLLSQKRHFLLDADLLWPLGNLELAASALGNNGIQTFEYGLMVKKDLKS